MQSDFSKPTLLVVDDMPENIDVLVTVLSSDYNLKLALNGESALKVATSNNPPDLILLDIMMPGMDGYEVCRRLKNNGATEDIPIIFVTAKGEISDETKGFAVGAVDYITKPVSPPIVLARVKNHLQLKAAREALDKQNRILQDNVRLQEQVEQMTRHDLKSPLTIILNLPDFISEEENITDSQRQDLHDIKMAGFRMLEIINNSLNLHKMETEQYRFEPKPVDLVKVLHQIAVELTPLVTEKKLALNMSINGQPVTDEDSFVVEGEELLFYSMLANLIKNAAEASSAEEMVSVRIVSGDPSFIHIHNPAVVPGKIRPRFFEKYATAGKDDGTGLGTYSARLMAETMSCQLAMQTSETEGTTLTVQLPPSAQANN